MFKFNSYFKEHNTLFIAEFANAFEGKKDLALEMIDKAFEANVDALKFQIFFADELLIPEHPKYNIFNRLETRKEDWFEILNYASDTHKLIFVDIYSEESLLFSKNFKVDAYKIPPSEMTNYPLINMVSSSDKSLILSTGATTLQEVEYAINICKKNKMSDIVLMHGFQNYPTKLEDINLNLIDTLEKTFNCPIGYADHVDGGSEIAMLVPILAVAKGAKLVEKHFTLYRDLKGIDYESSVNPDILKKIVRHIKDIDLIFGKSYKELSSDELVYKEDVRKRIVLRRNLVSGEKIGKEDVTFKRAPRGLFAEELEKIIGRRVVIKLEKNQVLEWECIN